MDKLTSHLALAQTFLFSPGHRPEFFNKALASASKAIIIDLEDAVPPEQKKQARAHIQEFWQNCSVDNRKRVLVRINPIDTDFTNEDLAFLNALEGPINVVVPKVESLEQLNQFAEKVPSLNFIIPIIESARGIDSVKAIATHPLVLRLLWEILIRKQILVFAVMKKKQNFCPSSMQLTWLPVLRGLRRP